MSREIGKKTRRAILDYLNKKYKELPKKMYLVIKDIYQEYDIAFVDAYGLVVKWWRRKQNKEENNE